MVDRRQVVVVPGFMGSTLSRQVAGPLYRNVWFSPTELLLNGPDALQLAPDGVNPGPLASGPLTVAGIVDMGIYEPVLTQLANDGWSAQAWTYDWRLSILTVGQQLATWLQANMGGANYWIVAHSMGGLVARIAYSLLPAGAVRAAWQRTVYCGTPHGGTYIAAQYLAGIQPDGWPVVWLADAIGSFSKSNVILWALRTPMRQRYLETLASWPALYECLPTGLGQWEGLDPAIPALFRVASYAATNPAVTQARLDSAAVTQVALDAALARPRPSEVCVVGRDRRTPMQILDVAKLRGEGGYVYGYSGDTVVSRERGTLVGARNETTPADHYLVIRGGAVLSTLSEVLLAGLDQDRVLIEPKNPIAPEAPAITYTTSIPIKPWSPATQRTGDP